MTDADKYQAYLARQRGYSQKYRKAHKAERAAYFRKWYQKNKARVAARRRKKRIAVKAVAIKAQ
jgi:alpha-D-ribose 1-methylphosphonate 5-triphosphate diphosphatase PhnM